MRIAIATVQVPFIRGGAEALAEGLKAACQQGGHEVELITMPFRFDPPAEVSRTMNIWEGEDFERLNGYTPDVTICLKFPTYYLNHSGKVVWLLHQHRAVYDLWPASPGDESSQSAAGQALRKQILEKDAYHLKQLTRLFTISENVSQRLWHYNRIKSTSLHHPPPLADKIYSAPAEPYIFFPSRLETLKRQSLLIEAMCAVKSPVVALIAGSGGQAESLQAMIARHGLGQRVRLLGAISEQEMLAYYAHCLGVFFGPLDEDYGYVTLEAMLAAKPVITCTDSGGPLEFVVDKETGWVVEPEPTAIAEAIDHLYAHQDRSLEMGLTGRERYRAMNISWRQVVESLLSKT